MDHLSLGKEIEKLLSWLPNTYVRTRLNMLADRELAPSLLYLSAATGAELLKHVQATKKRRVQEELNYMRRLRVPATQCQSRAKSLVQSLRQEKTNKHNRGWIAPIRSSRT